MSTENEKIRIIDLSSGDNSVSMTDANTAVMADSDSTGSKKLSLFAILEKIIAYIKTRPSRVLPDSNPNQVLSTDENNNVVWKEPTAQVNADWNSTQGASQILHKPDLSVYATSDALDAARTTLSNSISEESSDRMSDVNSLRSDLTSESSTRSEADANINASLTAEIDARTSGDAALQSALESKANASELSVTPGTGSNADKATIQLKDGVSATVLTAHQNIPEQKQADWNESDSSKVTFISNKPTDLSNFTNDLGFITGTAIEGKAEKSEMSITPGTGTATIQLKTGTSATVLTQHQDISNKADKSTTYTKTEVDTALNGKAAVDHNHDDRYYTETEVDTALANKADKATTLAGYGITNAKIANGTITLGSQSITPVVASDIEGKAEKSEMSITAGTGTATIQLKTGTSATVLTEHQKIPEQKQADWNESDSSKVTFISNKPSIPEEFNYVSNGSGLAIRGSTTQGSTKREVVVDGYIVPNIPSSGILTADAGSFLWENFSALVHIADRDNRELDFGDTFDIISDYDDSYLNVNSCGFQRYSITLPSNPVPDYSDAKLGDVLTFNGTELEWAPVQAGSSLPSIPNDYATKNYVLGIDQSNGSLKWVETFAKQYNSADYTVVVYPKPLTN